VWTTVWLGIPDRFPTHSLPRAQRKAGFDAKRTLLLHVLTTKNGMCPKILVKHANKTFNENPKFSSF
jgi:hypothetical protein